MKYPDLTNTDNAIGLYIPQVPMLQIQCKKFIDQRELLPYN